MASTLPFDRRTFAKWMCALPLLTQISTRELLAQAGRAVRRDLKNNIYTRIGVTPIINARGTWTYISGSLEFPEVVQAKHEAARYFVDMWELQRAVGKRLAELSGAESGLVTAGAAAAMATATAACIAGSDPAKVWQLPDSEGLKNEVIMFGGRSLFDSGIRAVGGKLVVATTHDELKAAINEKTAMVYTSARDERLEQALLITKPAGVPLMVDWAAAIPPIENLLVPAKMGVDLFTFSGGKGLCGPQCSGLLLGRKDLIDAALANSSPWEGAVCRPMKVGKEEIMGCLTAVETWKKKDLSKLDVEWTQRLEKIVKVVETVPTVETEIVIPERGNRYPTLTVTWDEASFKLSVAECAGKLLEGNPRIEVLWPKNRSVVPGATTRDPKVPREPRPDRPSVLRICSMTLQPGEELVVAGRLRDVLTAARRAA